MVRTTFGLTSKAMLKASALDAMAKAAAIAARPARACGACPPARRRDDRRRLCGADLHIFVGYLYLQTKMVYCKWVGTFNKCSGRLHLTVDGLLHAWLAANSDKLFTAIFGLGTAIRQPLGVTQPNFTETLVTYV